MFRTVRHKDTRSIAILHTGNEDCHLFWRGGCSEGVSVGIYIYTVLGIDRRSIIRLNTRVLFTAFNCSRVRWCGQ